MKLLILWMMLHPLVPPVSGSLCSPQDPDFDEYRYSEKIAHCKRNVTTARKNAICARDGVFDRTEYTVDHILPLSLGGSNKDDNLWCQHKSLAVTSLEYKLFTQLRDGAIRQFDALNAIIKAKFKGKKYVRRRSIKESHKRSYH